jgi:hypothetical protein
MPRLLAMAERRVPPAAREAYLASLAGRQAAARDVQAHFWVFEHTGEDGRFLEFVEGPDESALRAAGGHDMRDTGALVAPWREVQGE